MIGGDAERAGAALDGRDRGGRQKMTHAVEFGIG